MKMAAKAKAKKSSGGRKKRGVSGNAVGSRGRTAKGANGAPKGMTPDEELSWINKLDRLWTSARKAQEEAKEVLGVYRSALKEAGKIGFNKDAYIDARDMDKEDHGTVQIRYADIGRQLRLRNSNLATEMELFQGIEPSDTASDDPPAVRGLKAGRSGFARASNPFKPGSKDYVEYDENWSKGVAETEALRTRDPAGTA